MKTPATRAMTNYLSRWLRSWFQRSVAAEDELAGPETESFKTVVRHIEDFMWVYRYVHAFMSLTFHTY